MLASACGDNASECPVGHIGQDPVRCTSPARLAARDATRLFPEQDVIDTYVDRWNRAVEREPLTAVLPQRYRNSGALLTVYVNNSSAITAWMMGRVTTGDVSVDEVFTELKLQSINPNWSSHPDGPYGFILVLDRALYSEEVLAARLEPLGIHMDPATVLNQSDSVLTWTDSMLETAQIDVSYGWGDCFVSCAYFHRLQAIVPPHGLTTVYDLGGDPLPPGVVLAPTTVPKP